MKALFPSLFTSLVSHTLKIEYLFLIHRGIELQVGVSWEQAQEGVSMQDVHWGVPMESTPVGGRLCKQNGQEKLSSETASANPTWSSGMKMVCRVGPCWIHMSGPFYVHLNQSLTMEYPGQGQDRSMPLRQSLRRLMAEASCWQHSQQQGQKVLEGGTG